MNRTAMDIDTIQYQLSPLFLHEKEGVIEVFTDRMQFDTLHNFNVRPGTSWKLSYGDEFGEVLSLNVRVLDTFYTEINHRRVLAQSIDYASPQLNMVDTVYAMLGNKWSYILPWHERYIHPPEARGLLCFKNDYLGTVDARDLLGSFYENTFNYVCESTTSTHELSSEDVSPSFQCMPNPVSDILFLDALEDNIIRIYYRTGHLKQSFTITKGINIIDVQGWQRGIYWFIDEQDIGQKILVF
ncbi:MAG: hypothetical protein AAF738_00905 [Bacteroidota bacterium]